MNIKLMKEKRSKILKEAKSILEKCSTEVRGMTNEENTDYESKMQEAASLQKTIELAEERARIDADETEVVETETSEDRSITEDAEVRAVNDFIKNKGNVSESRAMTTTGDGAAVIPTNLYDKIERKLFEVAPLFAMSRKFTPVSGTLEVLKEKVTGEGAWVGEMTDITTSDFKMDKITLTQKRAGSAIQLTQQLINDAGIDVVNYSMNLLAERLGRALDRAVINGDPSNKQFNGLLNASAECNVSTQATTTTTIDDYIETYNNMHPSLISGSCWVVSRKEFNHLAKLKNSIGDYYLIRDVIDGMAGYKLLGLPVYISDVLTVKDTPVTGDVYAILVNMNAAYATMIKKGAELKTIAGDTVQALKGAVLLMMDMYVDGNILNEDAIRILKAK